MPFKPKTKFVAARYGELTGTLLLVLAEGVLATTLGGMGAAPKRARLYRAFDVHARDQIDRALRRLRVARLVRFDLRDEQSSIVITTKGLARAEDYKIKYGHLRWPRRWDHLFRICLFDIPETRHVRNLFQSKLKRLGWLKLQKSVYVHPHDREQEILKLARRYRVSNNVLVLTVPSLGSFEYRAREYFFNK